MQTILNNKLASQVVCQLPSSIVDVSSGIIPVFPQELEGAKGT